MRANPNPEGSIKDFVLEAIEASLDAQLRAIRQLRKKSRPDGEARQHRNKSMSQMDMAYNILLEAGAPIHVTELLRRIESAYGVAIDRESLVSALVKRVLRQDRFARTDKNTFTVRR